MTPEITIGDPDPIDVPHVDRSVRPRRRTDVGAVAVQEGGVIAGEHATRPIALDAVAWSLWQAMDGTCRVEDLAQDLAWAADLSIEAAGRHVGWLVQALAVDGFLEEPMPMTPVLPRRVHPNVPADSCLGRRLGLSRSRIVQLKDAHGEPFLAGCTEASILDEATGDLEGEEVADLGLELIFLRATVPRGGRERLQQVLDSLSNPLFASRDLPSATEAFARTIHARRQLGDGVWSEGVALQRAGRALLVHPRFRDAVTGPPRAELGRRGITFVPSGLLRFEGTGVVTTPPVPGLGMDEGRWEVVGVLVPPASDAPSRLTTLLPIARTWDQAHVEHLAAVVDDGRVVEHPLDGSTDDLVAAIDALLPSG